MRERVPERVGCSRATNSTVTAVLAALPEEELAAQHSAVLLSSRSLPTMRTWPAGPLTPLGRVSDVVTPSSGRRRAGSSKQPRADLSYEVRVDAQGTPGLEARTRGVA